MTVGLGAERGTHLLDADCGMVLAKSHWQGYQSSWSRIISIDRILLLLPENNLSMTTVSPTANAVLETVDALGPPGTPVTTPEVADGFDCTQRTIYNKLNALVSDGVLQTKKVGANSRVWWRPVGENRRPARAPRDQRIPVALREQQEFSFLTDSEMAERIRKFEWADTPLGSVTEWPAELRVAVNFMLGASDAIGIYWGEELRLLYNDAAIEQIGEKHPDALGQPAQDVFPEAWDELGPIHNQVLAGSGSVRNEEHLRPLERAGELEDIWWDTSFSPILTGDGSVGGVVNISFDVTDRVQAERKLREHKGEIKRRYRQLFESINEGFCIVDVIFEEGEPVDYRIVEANEAFEQFARVEHAEGRTVNEMGAVLEHSWYERYGQVARTGESFRFQEHVKACGKWFDVFAFRIGENDSNTVAILFDDITERKRAEKKLRESEATLERLNDATQELIDAETTAIADRVAPLVRTVLDAELASLWRYDDRKGELEAYAVDAVPEIDARTVMFPDVISEQVWETFIGGDIDVANDLAVPTTATAPLRSHAFVPLGRHGVVCLCSTECNSFDERTVDLLETVAATVETAWNRAASEQELAGRNEELTRLDRLNSLIREIDQALVAANTRKEIDETVCERLAASDLYEFAWVGAFDADAETIQPRSWAGIDSSAVEMLAAGDDPVDAPDPFVTAIRTGEMQVIEDIATDTRTGRWRELALTHGGRSCFKIPLTYQESVYGVLVVYGRLPAQHHRDTTVLSELGRTIAHAINAIETRETFQAGSVVEVTVRLAQADTPLCRLSTAIDGQIEFEGLVPETDDGQILFFTTPVGPPKQVVAAGDELLGIEELTPVTKQSESTMFRVRLSDSNLPTLVLDQHATVRSLWFDGGTATAVIDLPESATVRTFVEELTRQVSTVELLSRRTRTREPGVTIKTTVLDQLTPRQQEVLQLAYRSGYFETPREQTGEELATLLGIVPSTFAKHIRSAQGNLLDAIFRSGHELAASEAK